MKLTRSSDPWYVIATAPNAEEKAARKLTEAGFHVYLPRYREDIHNKRTRTWRTVERVLLTGYLFVDVSSGHFGIARNCDGVRGFVGACGIPERVSGKFVEQFQIAEQDGAFDKLNPEGMASSRRKQIELKRKRLATEFDVGETVAITQGPFADFFAEVLEVTRRAKVKVGFQLFGREMDAEIEAEHLSAA